jgi:5-methylthioadenosine/S-adenosylhomocysteine deaminase
MSRSIIKNVNIITMNVEKSIIENGVVIVNGDTIEAVGDSNLALQYSDSVDAIIDGNNGILMPGMVNAHTHASMVVFRSLGDDIPDRLKKYIFPLEQRLIDKAMVALGARYAVAEMLLGGVTTFADMYYFEDEVALAVKEIGIRAVLGETVLDFPSPDSKKPYGGLEYGEWFIKKWKRDNLIIPAIAPHAPYSNDSIHLRQAFDLAQEYDVPIMMHVAEMDYESRKYKEEYKMSPVEYLDSIGVLNNRLTAAHLINVSEEDLDLIQRRNVGISHNIGANSKGAKGVAPAAKMYNRGMKLGLGTDGPMSGNTLDIITQMSLVGKIHKLFNNDRSLFPALQIVEMATIGGAKALNLQNTIGSIEAGKKADMVIIETQSINMQPLYDYYSCLVYSANASNVDTVIIAGKVLVKNKRLLSYNIKELISELKKAKENILTTAKSL